MELLEHVRTTLIENNLMIIKNTPTELNPFRIVDDSLASQNEVNNLTVNNPDELNLDFDENGLLPNYNIDTTYSHQVVSRLSSFERCYNKNVDRNENWNFGLRD